MRLPGRGRGGSRQSEGQGRRVPRRRAHAARDLARGARWLEAVLQEGRSGDRRERLGDLRRRGGDGDRERSVRHSAGIEAIGAAGVVGGGRRRAAVHGHRPGARGP